MTLMSCSVSQTWNLLMSTDTFLSRKWTKVHRRVKNSRIEITLSLNTYFGVRLGEVLTFLSLKVELHVLSDPMIIKIESNLCIYLFNLKNIHRLILLFYKDDITEPKKCWVEGLAVCSSLHVLSMFTWISFHYSVFFTSPKNMPVGWLTTNRP